MTPQERRKKIAKFRKSKNQRDFSLRKLLIPLLILVAVLSYIWITSRTFARNPKLTVAVGGASEVYLSVFDRESGSIYRLTVPAGTQFNVSRQLGTWKSESVWRLGENERLGGELLRETIIKNFKIPVAAWADEKFLKLSSSKTNLGVGDRFRLGLFSMGVAPARRVNLNLSQEGFLRKTKLVGGEEGYLVGERLPGSLADIFADPKINSANLRIEIQNFSERKSGAVVLAAVLEVLGTKAAAITSKSSKDFLCEVDGQDREITAKIARIFDCKVTGLPENNFDITIKIGEEFVKRF